MKLNFLSKKRYIILLSVLIILFIVLFFLSSFTRNWIEKNSMKLIGRKIEIKELHFNYFRCSVRVKKFVMFEKNSSDYFISFEELYVNYDPLKLIKKEITFSEIKIVHPAVNIVYNNKIFNFDDLEKLGGSEKGNQIKSNDKKPDTKYVIMNFSITEGEIKYADISAKTSQEIKKLGINLPYISWNSEQSKVGIDFALGQSGKVSISGLIDQELGKYLINLKTQEIEISPFTNYFKSYIDVKTISGKLYSDLEINGDMSKPTAILVTGEASLKKCIMKDRDNKEFLSAENAKANFESLDIGKSNYKIGNLILDSPKLVAILYKNKMNLEVVLAPYFADTTKSTDTTKLRYSIKNMQINNGEVLYTDMTLHRQFDLKLQKINATMENFSESSDRIPVKFSMSVNNTGSFSGNTTLSMVNYKKIDFKGNIRNVEILSFSPYSEYYIARPIIKGIMNYSCMLKMNPSKLENLNIIKVDNPKFGKKTKDTCKYKVPVNLALYILKDSKGIVNIELPVEGKPSDPSFKLKKIIWKTLENFLLKSIAQPFVAIGKLFGANPERIKTIPFNLLQDSLGIEQKERLDKLSDIILKKQDLAFNFSQTTNQEKEKELLAIKEVKTNFITKNSQGINDTKLINKQVSLLSDNDPSLLKYIKSSGADSTKTFGERCRIMTGSEKINILFAKILDERNKLLNEYLLAKGIPQQSIIVKTSDLSNLPEELKVPQFTIDMTMP